MGIVDDSPHPNASLAVAVATAWLAVDSPKSTN
jgi:hypothetical protein